MYFVPNCCSMRYFVVLFFFSAGYCKRNNVCKEFWQYNFIDVNSNCWYNPDVDARSADLIVRYGYPLEQYEVVTEDAFVLTVFRIPPKNQTVKGIVFLQHPALASSSVWLVRGNISFAFLLSDAGYDVWLGNFRATSYSENNKLVSRTKNPNQYWNYSFHEFGVYDLPAQVELVRQKTNYSQKIIYIGHSVATTAGMVYASLKPREAEKHIQLFIWWSPIAFLGNVKTPLRVLAPFTNNIHNTLKLLDIQGITYDGPLHDLVKRVCLSIPSFLQACSLGIDEKVGPQYKHGNPPELPLLYTQSVEGFSIKTLAHFGQLVNAKNRFQWYDYGSLQNKVYYNSKRPPSYPLDQITIPVRLAYGANDYLATEKDTYVLYSKLQDSIKLGVEKVQGFSHFDFHYGQDVDEILHKPAIKYLDEYLNKV